MMPSRRRRDVAAYTRGPQTNEEAALAAVQPDWTDLADDTDWDVDQPEV